MASIDKESVYANHTRERILHSPVYDPHLVEAPTREFWEPFYGYYGVSPYLGIGYLYPGFPLSRDQKPVHHEHSIHTPDL